ncbi:hypothetical protein [Amycolatopsis cihanbeyliensis]|uniref:hypothetical protein n=1 Tax=Amycolatopsis cihanbeyliensis TaxID=1128664 RepID=UPI001FE93749|nr:hypothetical protein [Amycolatopsis cihanbeyliensis]
MTGDFELVVLPGVSHWVPEEAPNAITDAVVRLARGNPASTGPTARSADRRVPGRP